MGNAWECLKISNFYSSERDDWHDELLGPPWASFPQIFSPGAEECLALPVLPCGASEREAYMATWGNSRYRDWAMIPSPYKYQKPHKIQMKS